MRFALAKLFLEPFYMQNWASWNSEDQSPSTLQGLSGQSDQSTQFTYLTPSSTKESDYTERLMAHNRMLPAGNTVRNPDQIARGKVVLARERDVHGKIGLTHSYTENGQIFHRQYSMDREELKEFLKLHPDVQISTEGEDQILHCGSDTYVQVESMESASSFPPPSLMAPVASSTRGIQSGPSQGRGPDPGQGLGSCFSEGDIIASNDRDYARYCTNVGTGEGDSSISEQQYGTAAISNREIHHGGGIAQMCTTNG